MGSQLLHPFYFNFESAAPFGVTGDQLDQLEECYYSTWDRPAYAFMGIALPSATAAVKTLFVILSQPSSSTQPWGDLSIGVIAAVASGVISYFCFTVSWSFSKRKKNIIDRIRSQNRATFFQLTSASNTFTVSEYQPPVGEPPITSASAGTATQS